MVKPERVLTRNEIQRRYRKRNLQNVKDHEKRFYLRKKAVQYGFGKDEKVVDRWMEEWKRTGKVSYE